jgi:hypothetical protein
MMKVRRPFVGNPDVALLNTSKEKKIGPYPVDGYDANTNTVYQFHECYWHGHECWMTKNVKDQKWRETRRYGVMVG